MPRVKKLHHVAIQVADLARSRAFYCDVLGMMVVREQEHSVWLDLDDGGILMLERCAGPAVAPPWQSDSAGLHLLALEIDKDSRPDWLVRLSQNGVAIEKESDYTIYLRDPDGTRIGLSSYPFPLKDPITKPPT